MWQLLEGTPHMGRVYPLTTQRELRGWGETIVLQIIAFDKRIKGEKGRSFVHEMANNSERLHIKRTTRDMIVESLDGARDRLRGMMITSTGTIPADVAAAINDLLGAVQWAVHQEPFLAHHQELWRKQSEDHIPF